MTNLQIPYAYTPNKTPMSPEVAEKGQDFSCPICENKVVLKRGDVRRPHFAHKPDTGCSGEGVDHKVAKQMIYRVCKVFVQVMNWKDVYSFTKKWYPFLINYEHKL